MKRLILKGGEPFYTINGFEFEARGILMEIYAKKEEEAEEIAAIHREQSAFHWERTKKKPIIYLTDVPPLDLIYEQREEANRKLAYRKGKR